ncbi:alpha/beta hydrolase family protein [Streptomyces sp. NPDC059104]|uniref:alpha/beta hydrolase family protein n=1 Tax=Streptomyces sp. NPDC059104 TaxID=3346729 RepID=UPI0036D04F7E
MRRRVLMGAAVAALLAGTCGTTAAHADTPAARPAAQPAGQPAGQPAADALTLPAPSGQRPVGRTTLHLRDEGRTDPWVPTEKRELMLSLWYPATAPAGTPAPYMTSGESELYAESTGLGLPKDLFTEVAAHATEDARPARVRGGLPLVILSPGFGMPRATLTGLAEELASRGYAVAGIGHNYEADGITFPDGHTTSCVACRVEDRDRVLEKVGAVRADDISFVIDELTGKRAARDRGVALDPGRIAVVGHSAGGFSTVPAMLKDPRVKAGVNMDGNFRYPDHETPVNRPLLMLGNPGHVPGGQDGTWDATWKQFTGWKRWLSVDGTQHLSFTDLAPLAKRLGRPLQTLDGDRVDTLTRGYVAAFLDTHLRGRDAPLLDGPSAGFPEVRFHRP